MYAPMYAPTNNMATRNIGIVRKQNFLVDESDDERLRYLYNLLDSDIDTRQINQVQLLNQKLTAMINIGVFDDGESIKTDSASLLTKIERRKNNLSKLDALLASKLDYLGFGTTSLCTICFKNDVIVVNSSCGHTACSDCSTKWSKRTCHVCKTDIDKKVKMYFSV